MGIWPCPPGVMCTVHYLAGDGGDWAGVLVLVSALPTLLTISLFISCMHRYDNFEVWERGLF